MKSLIPIIFYLGFTFLACETKDNKANFEKWKAEIKAAEKKFNDKAKESGVAEAFSAFAAEEAVLLRGNKIVAGKEAITAHFESTAPNDYQLTWSPDFIDVSASGDMAYTYGKYNYTTTDSLGNVSEIEGIFHTVWKRQADGNWKFVWD